MNVGSALSKMSSSKSSTTSVQRLGQHLKLLDTLCAEKNIDDELSAVHVQEATQAETKLWCKLNLKYVEQLTEMVNNKEYDEASEAVRENFPGAAGSSSFSFFMEEVLALLYVDNNSKGYNAIEWLELMDPEQQLATFEVLYKMLKVKGQTEQPLALLLLKSAKSVPASVFRVRLESDCRRIIDGVVEDIKNGFYDNINNWDNFPGRLIASFMPQIVRQFDLRFVKSVLLLIDLADYFCGHDFNTTSTSVVCTLLKELEERLLLDSEPSLHLWSLVKSMKENALFNNVVVEERFTAAWEKLLRIESVLFLYYQNYIEDQDNQKIKNLHEQNVFLIVIVPDFVTWYLKVDERERIKNLYSAARRGLGSECEFQLLSQIRAQFLSTENFEFFYFFNQVAQISWMHRDHSSEFKRWMLVQQLDKFEAPRWVCLLLESSFFNQQLRLINKEFELPLRVQEQQVFCCNSEITEGALCLAAVNADTALTTISFESAWDTCWKLDAAHLGRVQAGDATQWKIIAVDDDEDYVKIMIDDGKNRASITNILKYLIKIMHFFKILYFIKSKITLSF
jgi:hypothetical protein